VLRAHKVHCLALIVVGGGGGCDRNGGSPAHQEHEDPIQLGRRDNISVPTRRFIWNPYARRIPLQLESSGIVRQVKVSTW
jgi:hypothetical protein